MHLPTEEELLRGMPFFGGHLCEDIREYASRLGRRVSKRKLAALAPLASVLDALTVEQSRDAVQALAATLDIVGDPKGIPVAACRLRCRIYLASFGVSCAAAAVAGEIASLALVDIRNGKGPGLLWRTLSWAADLPVPRQRAASALRMPRSSAWCETGVYQASAAVVATATSPRLIRKRLSLP